MGAAGYHGVPSQLDLTGVAGADSHKCRFVFPIRYLILIKDPLSVAGPEWLEELRKGAQNEDRDSRMR
jgi:hypothetical protein